MNRLEALIAAGTPPLWLEADAYAARLLAPDARPWLDSAAYIAWHRKTVALLEPGVAAVNIEPIVTAWIGQDATTLAGMKSSRRAVAPLKHLLAASTLRAHLVAIVTGLRASYPKLPLALTVPSPRRWLTAAYRAAFDKAPEYGDDDVDAAAMYVADFLRAFGGAGIDLLLLEEAPACEPQDDGALELYQAVLNVAGHFRWGVGLRLSEDADRGLEYPGLDFVIGSAGAGRICRGQALGPSFWEDTPPPELPAHAFRYAEVPVDAVPEQVLVRLRMLRA